MRRAMVSCLILMSAAGLTAQDKSPEKYRVVEDVPWRVAVATINQAADRGYRVIIAGRSIIMRLEATPPDTYRYLALPVETGTTSFLNALNQQGAYGYKWVADTQLLEKEPHPRNYEYRTIEGIKPKRIRETWNELLDQGFRAVGMATNHLILVREVGQAPSPVPKRRIQPLRIERKAKFREKIAALAAQGYRYYPRETSLEGTFRSISMAECDSACGGPFVVPRAGGT